MKIKETLKENKYLEISRNKTVDLLENLSNFYTKDIDTEKKKLEFELNSKNQNDIENNKLFQSRDYLSNKVKSLLPSNLEVTSTSFTTSSTFVPTITTSSATSPNINDTVNIEKIFEEKEIELHHRYEILRKKEKERMSIEKKENDEKIKIKTFIELKKWRKIINIYNFNSFSEFQNENQHWKNENFFLNGSLDGFHISPFLESVTENEISITDYHNMKNGNTNNYERKEKHLKYSYFLSSFLRVIAHRWIKLGMKILRDLKYLKKMENMKEMKNDLNHYDNNNYDNSNDNNSHNNKNNNNNNSNNNKNYNSKGQNKHKRKGEISTRKLNQNLEELKDFNLTELLEGLRTCAVRTCTEMKKKNPFFHSYFQEKKGVKECSTNIHSAEELSFAIVFCLSFVHKLVRTDSDIDYATHRATQGNSPDLSQEVNEQSQALVSTSTDLRKSTYDLKA